MLRLVLSLIVLSFLAADASACGPRAGLFRGRVRERIVHRASRLLSALASRAHR